MKIQMLKLLFISAIFFASSLSLGQVQRRWVAAGHDGTISDLQVAPDGKFFVTTGDHDGRVIVWDGQTQKYRFHNDVQLLTKSGAVMIRPIAVSPSSEEFAVADTVIRFFNPETGAMRTMDVGLPEEVIALQFTTTGDTLGWVGFDTVYYTGIVDRVRGTFQTTRHSTLTASAFDSKSTAISVDGLDAILSDGRAVMTRTTSTEIIWTADVASAQFYFYGQDSIMSWSRGALTIRDRRTGTARRSISTSSFGKFYPTVSGGSVMLAYANGVITQLDVSSGAVAEYRVRYSSGVYHQDLLPRRSNRSVNEVYLCSLASSVLIPEDRLEDVGADLVKVRTDDSTFATFIGSVNQPPVVSAIAPNDSLLVIGALGLTALDREGNGSIRSIGHVVSTFIGQNSEVLVAAHFNGDNDYGHNYIFKDGGNDINAWQKSYDSRGTYIPNWQGDRSAAPYFSQSPNGRNYALGAVISDTLPASEFLWKSYAQSIWAPSNDWFYTLDHDSIAVFETLTHAKRSGRILGQARVKSFAMDSKGERIATAAGDGSLKVWSLPELTLSQTFRLSHGALNAVKFSPDGQSLITADSDGTIAIIDALTGAEKLLIRDSLGSFNGVEVTHDGKDVIGLVEIGVVDYDHIPVILAGVSDVAATTHSLICYPNPANGKLRIAFDAPTSAVYQIELIDALGRRVFRQSIAGKIGPSKTTLDLAAKHIAPGHYVCSVKSADYQAVENLVVE